MAPDGGADRKLFRMLFFEIMIDFLFQALIPPLSGKNGFTEKIR